MIYHHTHVSRLPSVRSLRSSSLKDFMRRQDEVERDRLRIEEQKRMQLAMIEERTRNLTKERERARLAQQVRGGRP